jgi:hypothetical protein
MGRCSQYLVGSRGRFRPAPHKTRRPPGDWADTSSSLGGYQQYRPRHGGCRGTASLRSIDRARTVCKGAWHFCLYEKWSRGKRERIGLPRQRQGVEYLCLIRTDRITWGRARRAPLRQMAASADVKCRKCDFMANLFDVMLHGASGWSITSM